MIRRPPGSPLFPDAPLFQSRFQPGGDAVLGAGAQADPDAVHGRQEGGPQPAVGGPDRDADAAQPARAAGPVEPGDGVDLDQPDRKSTRLNSSHANISYAVFC